MWLLSDILPTLDAPGGSATLDGFMSPRIIYAATITIAPLTTIDAGIMVYCDRTVNAAKYVTRDVAIKGV